MKVYDSETLVEVDPFTYYQTPAADWKQDFIDTCCVPEKFGSTGEGYVGSLGLTPPSAVEGDFLWLTHKGEFIYVSAMQTDHLFNAFRMVYNHSVPAAFRVGPFIRRQEVYGWSSEYRIHAMESMGDELNKRELSQEQADQLYDIENNEHALRLLLEASDKVVS